MINITVIDQTSFTWLNDEKQWNFSRMSDYQLTWSQINQCRQQLPARLPLSKRRNKYNRKGLRDRLKFHMQKRDYNHAFLFLLSLQNRKSKKLQGAWVGKESLKIRQYLVVQGHRSVEVYPLVKHPGQKIIQKKTINFLLNLNEGSKHETGFFS